ncbi:hypothetical protein BDN70DRAFT_825471 [Pholiota conissans]|uniref:Zinc-finger domain-containing protein n=1 Tax=Pholiota conissans TaxID=109636 RepID=A0A9P6CYT5_9AGAR|nr:hypothetical protein BDN70DRAFT_825471 [Pholiota conissans]
MSSTPVTHPSVQRLNKAYVQVPPSSLALSTHLSARSSLAHVAASSKVKENTPLRPSLLAMPCHALSSTSFKRKLFDRDISTHVMDAVVISSKKPRLSVDASVPLKVQVQPILPLSNASEGFPNGWVYCHQCNKKRDVTETVRCTNVEMRYTTRDKNPKERLCHNKYCRSCLKNRYAEDINRYNPQLSGKNGVIYGFKCPKCRNTCNCPRCRKSKGLEAIGFIPKEKPWESSSTGNTSRSLPVAPIKVNESFKARLKPLPQLKWISLGINLTQEEVDARACIREFVLRFGDFMDPVPAKCHIDELELIGGRQRKQDDDADVTGWVSDLCVRTLITSILGLLARDAEDEISKIIKSSVKHIKTCGADLNKIWSVMASMRDQIAKVGSSSRQTTSGIESPLIFPDPSPPYSMQTCTLRSLRQSADNLVTVVHSVQMIPILLSLIHTSLETSIIRKEIDQGVKDVKDFSHDARIATKIEHERWEKDRNAMDFTTKDKVQKAVASGNRDKRAAHKLQITNIENSLRIIEPSFSPRFTTLGTDTEGRVYYALSPGMAERESAVEFLDLAANDKPYKPKKRARLLSPEDRSGMREWSWFVAVWGKKPALIVNSTEQWPVNHIENDSGSENELEVETWWGFWEVDEIFKLAQWICIKGGLDNDDTSSNGEGGSSTSHKEKVALSPLKSQLKRLSMGLKDFAALLQWRIRDDKTTLIKRVLNGIEAPIEETLSKGRAKQSLATISPANFMDIGRS